MLPLQTIFAFVLFWHLLAFAAGGVYVALSYQALFNGGYVPQWGRVIRSADWHLWASGLAVIGLGIALAGAGRFVSDPKLWAKALVIAVWFVSTQVLRRLGPAQRRRGNRHVMLVTCSISIACWIYGAFLGVAKPLAGGAAPFSLLVTGFALTSIGCVLLTIILERKHLELARGACR